MKDVESRLSGTLLVAPSDDLDRQVERMLDLARLAQLGRPRSHLGRWVVPVALAAGVLVGTTLPRQWSGTAQSPPPLVVEVAPSPALERLLTGSVRRSSPDPFSKVVSELEVRYVAGSWATDRPGTGGQL